MFGLAEEKKLFDAESSNRSARRVLQRFVDHFLSRGTLSAVPDLDRLARTLPWLAPVAAFGVFPCALAASWGPKHIDPALVGILFMTEITVGGITAALMAGEPFGMRELAGVLLITGAALVDSVWDLRQARRAAAGAVERTRTSTVLPTSTSS